MPRNYTKVYEREDDDFPGFIILERVHEYKPRYDGPHPSMAKLSPKHTAPSSKALPSVIDNKPNNQSTPVTNTGRARPWQSFLQTTFSNMHDRITRVFSQQTAMGISGYVHDVAVKSMKAGHAMYKMAMSAATCVRAPTDAANTDDAGNTSHEKDSTLDHQTTSTRTNISTDTLQLTSREEDDFIILEAVPQDDHDDHDHDFVMVDAVPLIDEEDDFIMIDASPADEEDDFVMVDAVPLIDSTPRGPFHWPGLSARYMRALLI